MIKPGSFLSRQNTTKLTVYLNGERIKNNNKSLSLYPVAVNLLLDGKTIPGNNNIDSVMFTGGNDQEALHESSEPPKQLYAPETFV